MLRTLPPRDLLLRLQLILVLVGPAVALAVEPPAASTPAVSAPGARAPTLTPAEVDARAGVIFNEIMSPYCPGVLLSGCGSSLAADLRDSIKDRVRQGHSHEQIMDWLVSIYGSDILGLPSYSGPGALVWVLPGLALAIGLGGAYLRLRQSRQSPPPAPAPAPPADDALRQKLEAELRERD